MSLKSLVNKSIIKSDLRRFWYLGAVFMCGILLTVTIPIIESPGYASREFESWTVFGLFIILPFSIIIPAILFSYLHKRSAVCTAHSLPLSREGIFVSHIISGIILMVAPLIINALIMLSINEINNSDILVWVGLSVVYCILFSGMSIFSSAVSGNVFASIAIPAILILLPIGTASMYEGLADYYLFGFSTSGNVSLTNLISEWYLSYEGLKGAKLLIYIGIGLVFSVLGFFCYKRRALENNSSVTVFKKLNPVFVYGAAIYGGLLGAFYIGAVADIFSLWIAVPFGIAGIIIAKMLIGKSFKPSGVIKPSVIYIAVIAVLYVFFGLDITGYEKRIPDISDVEGVNISGYSAWNNYEYTYIDNEQYFVAPEAKAETFLTDTSDIEKVLALHKGIIKNKAYEGTELVYIPIYYRLRDGGVLARMYHCSVQTAELGELYFDVQDIPVVNAYRYPILSDRECEYVFGELRLKDEPMMTLTDEQRNAVIEALKADISASTAQERDGTSDISITLDAQLPLVDKDGNRMHDPKYYYESYETYYVRPTYANTLKLIEEWK